MKHPDDPVKFLRRRDYIFVRYLSEGASGQTALLYDDVLNEKFVCKKYAPYSEEQRDELFRSFVREIKLLYQVNHPNVVRIFNHYIYPDSKQGYILMEYVDGTEIDEYVEWNPEKINSLFEQAIEGFRHLEAKDILHRDIRDQNLMVGEDGLLKIIDLGFGKMIRPEGDFDKSISVTQWCESPDEFAFNVYDFQTEIYFVGKLFEKLLRENEIGHFKYTSALRKMCLPSQDSRIGSFVQILDMIKSGQSGGIEFSQEERENYRSFSDAIASSCHEDRFKIKIYNGR